MTSIVGPIPSTFFNGQVNDATQVILDLNWIVNQVNANALSLTGLAIPTGSSFVGYVAPGTGAVASTVQTKLYERVSLKDYGAFGNSSTADDAAINAAITYRASTGGGPIEVPYGNYVTTTQIVIPGGIYFVGTGRRASTFWVTHNLGDAFTVQDPTSPGVNYASNFGCDNISFRARVFTNNGSLLTLNKAQSVNMKSVSFEDHFGGLHIKGGLQHSYTQLQITSPRTSSPVSWVGVQANSNFLKIDRPTDNSIAAEIFFDDFNFRRQDPVNYIDSGVIINACDGVWFTGGHIGPGVANDLVQVTPVNGVEQITGLRFSNVWFDNNSSIGLHVLGGTTSGWGEIQLDGCHFLTQSNAAIFVEATATTFDGVHMTGGEILKPGAYGALLRAGNENIFTGVVLAACNTSATAAGGGICIQSGTSKVSVVGGSMKQTYQGVTASTMIGVNILSGASTGILVTGVRFDLAGLDISDASTSDDNRYPANYTTKAKTATALSGSSLAIGEIEDVYDVSAGLNFDNMTGRWYTRRVTLVFQGASTITSGTGGILLLGSANYTFKANDNLTLVLDPTSDHWREVGRMIS